MTGSIPEPWDSDPSQTQLLNQWSHQDTPEPESFIRELYQIFEEQMVPM